MHGYESPEDLMRSVTNLADNLQIDRGRLKDFVERIERKGVVRDFELKIQLRDGSVKDVSLNARVVRDASGKTLYYEGMTQDITERKQAFQQIALQRNLAMRLAEIDNLEEGLAEILKAAGLVSGMECGGISLKNDETGGFDLVSFAGLTKEFRAKIEKIPLGSLTWERLMEKKSFHGNPSKDLTPVAYEEGFRFISVVPILHMGEVAGCLVMASKVLENLPEQTRFSLELLAAELGNVIARMRARRLLGEEISTRKKIEMALRAERQSLQDANTALTVLLKHREDDKKELEEKLVGNVRRLIMPYVEKLKTGSLEPFQQTAVAFIDSNLKELISPFLNHIRPFNFTPRQLEIVFLIREGKTTKEIAQLLSVSTDAIDLQRFLIRKKLGLNRAKTNLHSYLLSLS